MKKYISFLFLLIVLTGSINAQFSFDKFMNEKLSKPAKQADFNMEELMKNAIDAKLDKIAIKVVNAKMQDGKIFFKSIANAVIQDAEAKKLNDLLLVKLLAKLGKQSKENVVNGVKNNMWEKPDGTTYMLTYSGNMCVLMVMKKK
ncbi:MAG: hypothetical protein C0412_16905 [Flavobacterium sp.]|nr:hypothetical protein [Flavobacterium sp.]